MPITPLPPAPSRATDNAATFSSKADALLGSLAGFVTETNASAAAMNSLAAGGAMTIPYTFDSATADADPGAGKLRLGNATQNLAVAMRLSNTGADGVAWSSVVDTFDDSSSTIKGFILLQSATNASKWLLFTVSLVASPAGYKNLTVAHVAGSAASPFAAGEALVLKFTRNGDKGDVGSAGLSAPMAVLTPTAVAAVDALTVFTAAYDNYLIIGEGIRPGVTDALCMRFAVAGVVDSGFVYYRNGPEDAIANTTADSLGRVTAGSVQTGGLGANFALTVHNVNEAALLKAVTGKAAYQTNATPGFVGAGAHCSYSAANAISGIRFFWSSGSNFTAGGKIRIYGYNN